jgi:hypothetical protein
MSFNLLGGYTAGIDGFELAGIFNINRRSMRFLQVAGIFNLVGDSTKGVQLSGVYNHVLNNASGLQVGGLVNQSHTFSYGIQLAGLANFDSTATGLQAAGIINKCHVDKGAAIAGLTNIAPDSSGIQIAGILNVGGNVKGMQLAGFMNIAKKVRGFQVGFINVADSSDYQIGILNINKNGGKSIAVSTDENLYTHLDFRSGGNVLYSLLGVGYAFSPNRDRYLLDVGLGVHIANNKRFFLNGEYVYTLSTDLKKDLNYISSIKVLPGFKLNKHFGLFAGPFINFTSQQLDDQSKIHGWVIKTYGSNNNVNTASIGITGGLAFMW